MLFTNQITDLQYSPKRLAVKLNPKGELFVAKGHPWVFSNNIIKIDEKAANSGDLAIIFNKRSNKLIGIGLYDKQSPIRIKMLYSGTKKVDINSTFFRDRIENAYQKRVTLLQTKTNSYRLLFGENDGFPGLIADVYRNVLVVKLYTEIWLPYLNVILEHLQSISKATTVVIRLNRQLQQLKTLEINDGDVVYGTLEDPVVTFIEHGVCFSANVIKGHKTGYFLDHRANRKQVGEWSKGKTVLDVFSYAGGFSVHALYNGATEVTSLDISKQALEIALENGKRNSYTGKHNTIVGDAFLSLKALINAKKTYDVVVIDPPSFAKQASEIELAKKKYAQLALLGAQLTSKRGLLVLASCSSRVTAPIFFDINAQVLRKHGRAFKTIKKTEHDTDHPVSFPEGAYLKCAYYRFLD